MRDWVLILMFVIVILFSSELYNTSLYNLDIAYNFKGVFTVDLASDGSIMSINEVHKLGLLQNKISYVVNMVLFVLLGLYLGGKID